MKLQIMIKIDVLKYDDLPIIEDLDIRHSWGVFDPSLGTLELLTPECVKRGVSQVRSGEVLSLNVPIGQFDPPLFNRASLRSEFIESARNTFEDVLHNFNPQSTSQWDGLAHIRAREFGFYSGIVDINEARSVLGIHHSSNKGIVSRGLLIDVASWREQNGQPLDPFSSEVIEVAEIEAIMLAKNLLPVQGDILCIRTGWIREYNSEKNSGANMSGAGTTFVGLASHHDMARFLWNNGFAAICSDNPAIESAPGDPKNGSLHRRLIPGLGFSLAELLNFENLAVKCSERSSWEFLFTAAPIALVGGASSTANALAII